MLRLLGRRLQSYSLALTIRRSFLSNLHGQALPPSPTTRFLSSSSSSSSSADANSALILTTLRSHGVPDDLSQSIVAKFPHILTLKPNSTLSPKLAFLRSEGFSGPELAEILLHNPFFLSWSLKRSLSPSVTLLKSILPSKDALFRALKYTNRPLTPRILANINVLKDHGIPEANILKLIIGRPRSLMRTPGDFVDALAYLKKINFSPTNANFVVAIGILSYMSRSTFQRKVEVYKELGWSEEEFFKMFKRQPCTASMSDQLIKEKVRYLMDTMGWGPEFLCVYPPIIMMSLEKRIIPRCAVLNLLMSNGLLERNTRPGSKFCIGKKTFVENYVKKYEETVPGVVGAYEGKIEFSGWDWLKNAKNQPEAT